MDVSMGDCGPKLGPGKVMHARPILALDGWVGHRTLNPQLYPEAKGKESVRYVVRLRTIVVPCPPFVLKMEGSPIVLSATAPRSSSVEIVAARASVLAGTRMVCPMRYLRIHAFHVPYCELRGQHLCCVLCHMNPCA